MAGLARRQLLAGNMRFMALHAGRNQTMPVMMTGAAWLLRVHAGELRELSRRAGMTIPAGRGKIRGQGHLPRRMRIQVTAQTLNMLCPVHLVVTLAALRHQLCPVVLLRVIGMKALVTSLALNPVPEAVILQPLEMGAVALPALGGGEGLGRCLVKLGFVRDLACFNCQNRSGAEEACNQKQKSP